MKVQTCSGSLYEIDTANKRVRRLIGANDPTPRQGKDGEWRKYDAIFPDPIKVGNSMNIIWTEEVELFDETKTINCGGMWFPSTTTSYVVSIDDTASN